MSDYNPNLGKTFDIKLSEDLLNLAEQMAQNVHDVWAKTRFEQGWTYGKVRNDEKKEHPCLVSYEELPENEKVYDRKTSQETLKFIMRKGFEIKHCSNLKNANDAQINSELKDLLEQMAKNVHDVWAKTRFEQGWRHGKVRNDEKKEHPCLVSYEELSENDKVYDRKTSQETLKFIMEKGFEIKHCLNPELRELSEQIAEKFHKEYFFVSYGKLLGDEEDCTLYIIQQTLKFIKKNGFEIEYCLDSKNANDAQINSELKALSKQMAKHVHDVWVKTHLDSGWKYGEDRNDEKKEHPCLVPFEKLSENEKDYDCKTSQEILKFIMEKGFRIVKKKTDFLHSIKEFLLNIESKLSILFTDKFTGKKHFRRNKSFIRYGLLMICFVLTMLTGIMLANIFPNLSKIILSFSVFIAGCYLVLLTYRPIFGRYYIRNAFFCFIFILGVIVYGSMHHHGFLTVDSQVKETGWLRFETKLFEAIDRGNHAIAAFFPSRGEYEALVDNSENKIEEATISEKQVYSRGFMRLYLLFHILVYLFFGYFTLTLWGHRLISRLNFFLVLDKNKNIFWCEEPNDKMLLLARDIYKTCEEEDVTFSVSEHKNGGSAKELYQNMNFMGFSLKLRKEEQIHNGCLRAKKHFFISDDSDWNIDMAKRFLMQREEKRINNKSKLYIKISNDARKKYFENWADDLNKKLARKIEIHFFDDSLLIARKFIENNPMYECIKKKKQPGKPYFEFGTRLKVLIIGFGEYGQAILDHIVCDSQYLACDTKGENKKRVKFSADIIEKDMQKCKYYESRLPGVCQRFNYKFIQNIADIQTAEFYDFMKEEINNYDRIVVALGNDYLNLECGIVLETIARKSVMLNSKKEIDELEEFKNKIFILQEKNIPQCENNLFTIFGNLDTIFTNEVITDEAMDEQAKLVNYVYEYIYSNEKTYKEDLPRMPKESLDWGKHSMFGRASSRASAAGIRNLVYLGLEENSNLDAEGWFSKLKREEKIKLDFMAETEHLRWMAFLLLQGYEKWEDVSSDLLKKANQTTKFCRHAALVEFDNLKSIDEKFKANIPLQEIDYYLVQCAMWIKNQE